MKDTGQIYEDSCTFHWEKEGRHTGEKITCEEFECNKQKLLTK